MKKILLTLTLTFLIITNLCLTVKAKTPSPTVSSEGAILMDAKTGSILYSKNIDTPYAPASTTKLMTALLTLENCKLDDTLTVGKIPPLVDGSKIYIHEGEKLKIKDTLTALLLASANDCAEALAEHIGGSIEGFAKMMNKKALELGCKNTNFVNPSGLYDDKHRTSSKDLALIAKELLKYPEFLKITSTQSSFIEPTNKSTERRPLWNENRLIQKGSSFYYQYCIGGKTGYTIQSVHSYVAFAQKGDQKLVVVLLHDNTFNRAYFRDAASLFEYGFNNFDLVKLYSKGDIVTNYKLNNKVKVPLTASKDFYYTKSKEDKPIKPDFNLIKSKNFKATDFKKGDNLFNATIKNGTTSLGTLDLLSNITYKKKAIISETLGSSLIVKLAIATILLIIIILSIFKYKKKCRHNSKKTYHSSMRS